jgi:type I restriction enzyme, S subunit
VRAEFAELGEVAEFVNGAAFKPTDWGEEGKRTIRIQNLTDPTKPYNFTKREVPERLYVQPGDLLVSWSATLGVFEWIGPDVAVLNQHIFRVLPNEIRVDKRYLCHGLEGALLEMQRHLHGATMQHVNRGEFLATKLYLPPLSDQQRIADLLDRTEVLRAKRRAALAQLDTLTQSIFIEMFGDPTTNSRGVQSVPLSEVTSRITDGTHLTPKFIDSGVPFIFVKNFKNGQIDFQTDKFISAEEYAALHRRCPVEKGDVLYTIVGATYGQAVAIGTFTKFAFQRHVAHLKPDAKKIFPEFLGIVMALPFVKKQADRWARGAAQPTVNLTELRQFHIPLPPMAMQREVANRVTVVANLKRAHSASLIELDALFASLQHRAFRGEL